MKTPHLNIAIKGLELTPLTELGKDILKEYKAIKSIIENTPIVSTPENPVWVMDETGQKRILLADLGDKCIYRYLFVCAKDENDFVQGKNFDYDVSSVNVIPYTEKVSIEVTEDEAVKVEEFLKGLRNGK
jgi:hypothetical protein